MSFMKKTLTAAFILAIACNVFIFGYDPPQGAFFLRSLYSPWGLASTPTVTGPASPWATQLNPSATGGSQLTQIEAGYTGVTDFGTAAQGWGSGAALSFSIPVPYGVWGGSASFFSVPAAMTDMDLGTFGSLRANFSKDLLSTLYIGSAIDITLGGNANFGWGIGLDLGATWFAGNLGFLKDTRFGLSILDIGKGYSTVPLTGIFGGAASSYPSAFTLGLGMRSYLLQSYNWNLDVALDLWSPSFQDLGADVSVGFGFREYVSLRLGWSIGMRDTIAGSGRSFLPSLGISGTIPLGKGFTLGKQSHKDASVSTSVAIAPLYDSLYAMGAGFNLSFGIKDKTAPVIEAELPVPFRGTAYISPDGDGKQDTLEIPVKISDERYIAGWKMTVEDKSSGKIIKTLGTSNDRVETVSGIGVLGDALVYTKKNVDVPQSIVWDGRDDLGMKVLDDAYTVSLVSWDDNGNYNLDYQSCITVVVDAKKPQANVWPLEPSMLFSPDGDGSKDNLAFRNAGSPEKTWTIDIADASGKVIRAYEYKDSAPGDFTWDGTAADGKRAPDGTYSLKLSAEDEAGNKAVSEVRNITIDTTRPAVTIATDESVMSPNSDGIRDSLHITTSIESFQGLESWKVFVLDPERKEVWSVQGNADTRPEQSYLFSGLSSKGETLADGQFEAGVELRYANGYTPQKLSAPFYMDRTPPSASIALSDENTVFSPDGDDSRDKYIFSFKSSEEETWNLVIRDAQKSEKVVRYYPQVLPEALEWNGRDDKGGIVPDGEYEVYVFAMDKAGNSFATTSSRVRVDTKKPAVAINLNREAFSPNNDGIAENVTLTPEIETKDGLVSWKFAIASLGQAGKAGLSFGSDAGDVLADAYVFEGKDKEGKALAEGRYKAELELVYINGFVAKISSAEILLDRTYPKAQVKADKASFNPAGNPEQSKIAIDQSGTNEDLWTAKVLDAKGNPVKKWTFAGELPSLTWDGKGDSGLIVPDGAYKYVVEALDKAGNSFASREISLEVDTLKKELKLAADSLCFSPNGDGVKDTLTLSSDATSGTKLTGWNLWIVQAEAGGTDPSSAGRKAVKSWQGGLVLPQSFNWNGLSDSGIAAPDGAYVAYLNVAYPNGDKAETKVGPFSVDRIPPRASVNASVRLFSPNGDGVLDTITFSQEGTSGDVFKGTVSTGKGEVINSWSWNEKLETLVWDGKDSTGSIVPDGSYLYELVSSDSGGNSYSSGKLPVSVETEKKAVRLSIEQRSFSPNGDGFRDDLGMSVFVQAPERVKSYELRIVAQEGPMAMNAVRVWKGGSVPQSATWKGETDSGVQAPDGRYAASLTVNYLNGDEIEASAPTILLDRIMPRINVSATPDIISPNNDGRSDSVEITQNSLAGDNWVGSIVAADGKVVKSYSWQDEVRSFSWNGKDETGTVVRDGKYRYVVESVDNAGNRTVSPGITITVESEKKAVRLDANTLAFSPNGDGKKDSILFGASAQYPDRIKSFELLIMQEGSGASNLPVKSWRGSTDFRSQYLWDGVTDSGLPAPDGIYRARLTVLYRNDDNLASEVGPFVVDRIAPQATLRLSANIFSPNGDGRSDSVDIAQESVPGDAWQGQIISSGEKIVRYWSWDKQLDSIVWDGKNQTGAAVPDGMYYYELRSIDQAENSFVSQRLPIEVDAAKKTVRFDVDQKAFSPNGDSVKDVLYMNIQAPKPQTIREYEIAVHALDAAGNRQANPVKAWRGSTDMKDQYAWDGRTDSGILVPDGKYQVALRLLYNNDDAFSLSSPSILVDTVGPTISASAAPLLFSPNGDGNKDTVTFTQNSSVGDDWNGRVRDASGAIIRTWSWKSEAKSFVWDGKNASGAVVRDGVYSYEVGATDMAGNAASAKIAGIRVDGTKPKVYVTTSDTGMSPNGDGIRDEVSFTIVVEQRDGIESWRFALIDKKGEEKSFFGGSGSDVPSRLVWDGRDLQGQVVQGDYIGKLVVNYSKGDVAQASSAPVLVDVDPPSVTISVDPEYFSPDGDGAGDRLTFGIDVDGAAGIVDWKLEVFETAIVESSNPNAVSSERLFTEWNGKGKPPAKIVWDGKSPRGELVESASDYPFKFVARDALGNTTTVSGVIAVDVLVIRDGDKLKIKIPSIVFRANYADFVGLSQDIIANNEKVIARVAQILNKFPDYRILTEGHANNVGKMLGYSQSRIDSEETKELIPLSTGRAELVRAMLIQNGVDARRLSVEGLGSRRPVVSFSDVENRWKNRRVEFVLIKNQ